MKLKENKVILLALGFFIFILAARMFILINTLNKLEPSDHFSEKLFIITQCEYIKKSNLDSLNMALDATPADDLISTTEQHGNKELKDIDCQRLEMPKSFTVLVKVYLQFKFVFDEMNKAILDKINEKISEGIK